MNIKRSDITPIRLLLIVYTVLLIIIYFLPIIPLGSFNEWYTFYEYLTTTGAVPYIDIREGYPPIGFLPYQAIYYLTGQNVDLFNYGFRVLNCTLLVATLYVLYLIVKKIKGEKKALLFSLIFASLPSVIITNSYSNDIIALFFSSLAIYFLIQKKPTKTGLMIGLGVLSKGFPLLLIIPAIFYFDKWRDKYRIIRSSIIVILIVSLPFVVFDLLTYYSTYVHHGTRGPWETIWALIDGWYSHGGFSHPYFDQFFYHSDILNVYELSSFDHAFYLWQYPWLPDLLSIAPIIFILLGIFIFRGKKDRILQFVGYTYFIYMLFFKGYSSQFSVTSPFYALISLEFLVIPFISMLELSQLLQWLSWAAGWTDQHQFILFTSILLRTVVFILIIFQISRNTNYLNLQKISIKKFLDKIQSFKIRKIWKLIFLALLSISVAIFLFISIQGSVTFKILETNKVETSLNAPTYIQLNELDKDDRIMLKLETRNEILVNSTSTYGHRIVERGVINSPSFRGYFDDMRYFFKADYATNYTLELIMLYPSLSFRMTEGLFGDATINISEIKSPNSMLNITIRDRGEDNQKSMIRLAYPIDDVVDDSFEITLIFQINNGTFSDIFFDIFNVHDDWLYSFDVLKNSLENDSYMTFKLNKDTKDTSGSANLFGDKLCLIAVSLFLNDGEEANIIIKKLEIKGNASNLDIPLNANNNNEIKYTIYHATKYQPEIIHFLFWAIFVILLIAFDREMLRYFRLIE